MLNIFDIFCYGPVIYKFIIKACPGAEIKFHCYEMITKFKFFIGFLSSGFYVHEIL